MNILPVAHIVIRLIKMNIFPVSHIVISTPDNDRMLSHRNHSTTVTIYIFIHLRLLTVNFNTCRIPIQYTKVYGTGCVTKILRCINNWNSYFL